MLYHWFEINSDTYKDQYKSVCGVWCQKSTPVLTAQIWNIGAYIEELAPILPKETIFGFKTSGVIKNRDDYLNAEKWKEIADVANSIYYRTGNPVLLENETAFKNANPEDDLIEFNYDALEKVFYEAGFDCPIWLWPGVGSSNDIRTKNYMSTAEALMESTDVKLIDHNEVSGSGSPTYPRSKENFQKLKYTCWEDYISIIYLEDGGSSSFWDIEDLHIPLKLSTAEDIIIYPGVGDLHRFNDVNEHL